MAKRFRIAQNPTFKSEVAIPLVGGGDITVPFEFKYYNRIKLAEMFDEWREEVEKISIEEDSTLADVAKVEVELQTKQILAIVKGWGFEEEFNEENVRLLVEGSIRVVPCVQESYMKAYTEAKSGN